MKFANAFSPSLTQCPKQAAANTLYTVIDK
jgi:hypothetical protein